MPIDQLIHLPAQNREERIFGADTAEGIAAHAKKIKAEGAAYCDCPACAIVEESFPKEAILK